MKVWGTDKQGGVTSVLHQPQQEPEGPAVDTGTLDPREAARRPPEPPPLGIVRRPSQ